MSYGSRRRATRAPDELGRQRDLLRPARALQQLQQKIGRGLPDRDHVAAHHRDLRRVQLRQGDVVAADEGEVDAQAHPALAECAQRAVHEQVAAGDDRRRGRRGREDALGRLLAVGHRERPFVDDAATPVAGGGDGLLDAQAALSRRPLRAADDQRDLTVPELEQVPGRRQHAGAVVEDHARGADAVGRVAVEQDDRDVRLPQELDGRRMALLREREDEPVDAPLLQQLDVLGIQLGARPRSS